MELVIHKLAAVKPVVNYVKLGSLSWDGSSWVSDGSAAADNLLQTESRYIESKPADEAWGTDMAKHYRSSIVVLDVNS